MPTLGEELKRRREERGIALTEISEATRIGTRFLKAIEANNFSILPGGIFTRSFIRAYAKEVGMNEDEAIGLYQQQVTGEPSGPLQPQPVETRATRPGKSENPQPVETQPPVEKPQRRAPPITYRQTAPRTNWSSLIIAGGILLFIVIVVVALVKTLNKSSEETPQQTTASTNQPAPPAPPANQNQNQAAPPPEGMFTVKIEAIKASWVQYTIDDGTPQSGKDVKPAGWSEVLTAQKKIKLDYGTLGTLRITINGSEPSIPPDAAPKEGHLLLTPAGIQPTK